MNCSNLHNDRHLTSEVAMMRKCTLSSNGNSSSAYGRCYIPKACGDCLAECGFMSSVNGRTCCLDPRHLTSGFRKSSAVFMSSLANLFQRGAFKMKYQATYSLYKLFLFAQIHQGKSKAKIYY